MHFSYSRIFKFSVLQLFYKSRFKIIFQAFNDIEKFTSAFKLLRKLS